MSSPSEPSGNQPKPSPGTSADAQWPLLKYVHSRFREALGEPCSTLEKDSQWSIRSEPKAPAIFVLVNGSYEKPAVWIFDPYTTENVWRVSVTSDREVDDAILEIKRRAASAAASWKKV
jgi:hypothetical protein